MAEDEEEEEQQNKLVIPKYKLIYEDPEIDIKMPPMEGEERQNTEEQKEEIKDDVPPKTERPMDIIINGKFFS